MLAAAPKGEAAMMLVEALASFIVLSYSKNREIIQMKIIDATPMSKVTMVCVLYPSSGFISPKLVTTQK